MSFDIFLQCFRNGEVATFKRAIFEEIFGPYLLERPAGRNFVRAKYPDGGGADIYVDDEDELTSMMFNHCGGDAFYNGLLQLADRIQGIIYWAGLDRPFAITDAAILEHLPAVFVEDPGPPNIVRDRDELTAAIRRS